MAGKRRWFHEEWLAQLAELAKRDSGDEAEAIIERTLRHHRRYFEERDKATKGDMFAVLAAPWLSSLERACLWVGGTKPALIVKLAAEATGRDGGLTAEQALRIDEIAAETKQAENEISEAVAGIQETVAAPPAYNVARQAGRRRGGTVDGETTRMDDVTAELREALAGVVASADALRGSTMRRVLDVLTPSQALAFLSSATDFQLLIRSRGLQMDAQKEE